MEGAEPLNEYEFKVVETVTRSCVVAVSADNEWEAKDIVEDCWKEDYLLLNMRDDDDPVLEDIYCIDRIEVG